MKSKLGRKILIFFPFLFVIFFDQFLTLNWSLIHFSALVDPVGLFLAINILIRSVAVTDRKLSGSATFFLIFTSTMSLKSKNISKS